MPLTDTAVRLKKAGTKPEKLFDERGLYLLVVPGGGKWWRLKYRFGGKEKLLSLGTYPDTTLSKAREKRDEARRLIAGGIDPSVHRQAVKAARGAETSFEAVAREWITNRAAKWSRKQPEKVLGRLERHVFKHVGARPVGELTALELLPMFRRVEAQGAQETAHKLREYCGQVFRYAIATGRAERDPAADLRGALKPIVVKHHASVTDPRKIAPLLRDLAAYEGSFVTRCALRLAPLLFVRPGELRQCRMVGVRSRRPRMAYPCDQDEDGQPAHRAALEAGYGNPARASRAHRVRPLSVPERAHCRAADEREHRERGAAAPGLRQGDHDGPRLPQHGVDAPERAGLESPMRSSASLRTLERNKVRGAYNYAEHLPERRKMMQAWADYLESLEKRQQANRNAHGKG